VCPTDTPSGCKFTDNKIYKQTWQYKQIVNIFSSDKTHNEDENKNNSNIHDNENFKKEQ